MRLIKYNVFGDTFQNYAPTVIKYVYIETLEKIDKIIASFV
jgi:hypothetical protein